MCKSLLKQVSQVAMENPAAKITNIYIRVGPLSGVEPALLKSAFPLARSNTPAAEANLVIHTPPVRVKCRDCGVESSATPSRLTCSHCGNYNVILVSGDELLLERIEFRNEH